MEEAVFISILLLVWGVFFDKPRRIWAAFISQPNQGFDTTAGLLVNPSTGQVQPIPVIAGMDQELARFHPSTGMARVPEPLGPYSLN